MPTHTFTSQWARGNDTLSHQVAKTADGEINLDVAVADESTDLQAVVALDVSALKSLYIVSDQAVTIETNDGLSPDDTLTLAAGVPIAWHDTDGTDNPLGTDVTDLYFTNASGNDAIVKIRALQDVTP